MSINPGTRLGPYEIVTSLGAGGMGEVYKARDTRLDRAVAIKVIASLSAGDPDLRQRFEREARAISQLSHPHICALYDVGLPSASDGPNAVSFLVMELIEGETLSDRLSRGPLPVEQALRTAIEIADALSAAHRRGIIHRDLKPGNVMLTKSGAKLLDFGLARIAAPAASAAATALPTTPANLTAQGSILGTFQYMAPEQLEGQDVDARADIFAFGSLLFEMLTGRRAFEGKSQAGLISAIMTSEPPRVTAAQPLAPASIDYAVSRCLAKDPDDRWQSARDLSAELRRIAGASQILDPQSRAASSGSGAAVVVARRRRISLPWMVAAAATTISFALLAWMALTSSAATPSAPRHLAIPIAPSEGLAGRFALSPDGTKLAFLGQKEGRPQLYLRSIDRPEAVLLATLPSFSQAGPTFSPDGKWVAFAGATKLWKVSVDGGSPVAISQQVNSATGRPAWAADGTIIYENFARGLSRISVNGGEPVVLSTAAPGEVNHASPWITRDGKTLLYSIRNADSNFDSGLKLVAQSLETGKRNVLIDGTDPIYLESGHLLFARQTTIFMAPFDPAGLRLTGDPAPVLEGVSVVLGVTVFAAAQDGSVAYQRVEDGGTGEGHLTLVDDRGAMTPLRLPPHRYSDPRLSPDGTRAVVHVFEEGRENYVADLKRGTLMRLTFDPGEDETPIWTPDGRTIVYTSTRPDVERGIYRRRADGSGAEELLWSGKGHAHLGGFTPDGRTIVLSLSQQQQFDLATFTVGDKDVKPLLTSRYNKVSPALSYDGRWLAYVSDETGRPEVYVQPYPSLDGRWPISSNGGAEPIWSRDGRHLYFRTGAKMMAVSITTTPSFVPSSPAPLFDDRFLATQGDSHTCYDVDPSGRFLMVSRADRGVPLSSHVNVVFGLLSRR